MCCGIIYKGRFGEVLIDPHLFKPCCRKQQRPTPPAPQGAGAGYLEDEEEEEEEEEEVDVEEASVSEVTAERSTPKNGLEEVLNGALEEEVVVVKEEVVVKEDELNTGTMQLLLAAV